MEYRTCLVFIFMLSVVRCNQCSDQDLKELFMSNSGLCQQEGSWTFSEVSVTIDEYHDISNGLTPSSKSSCITSSTLSLATGGTLKVKAYAKSITNEDYLTVLVYESKENNVVGQASLSKEENAANDGWHDLKINLRGVGYFNGYIMLIGKSSVDSNILVESICYSPADEQKLLSENTSSAQFDAPDIYALQTGSALLYKVHPNENRNQMETDVTFENRSFWIFDAEDFWTPLTISLAVVIPLTVLALLSWACFALGKRKGAKQESEFVYQDIDNLPKPYVVPRVKNVYAESVASSQYAGRDNNMYSA